MAAWTPTSDFVARVFLTCQGEMIILFLTLGTTHVKSFLAQFFEGLTLFRTVKMLQPSASSCFESFICQE